MAHSSSLLAIVELCIAENSDYAWRQFEQAIAESLKAAFAGGALGAQRRQFSEFQPWFTNWAYRRRILHAAYRRLKKEREEGGTSTDQEQSAFLLNYVLKAARNSALPEYMNESASAEERLDESAMQLRAPHSVDVSTERDSRADLFALLAPGYRVPFLLRHYKDLGYPSEEDINWMANKAGKGATEVKALLDHAIQAESDAAFPIPTLLIAELCGISETLDGGQAAIDQRVRRARLKLQELVRTRGGADD